MNIVEAQILFQQKIEDINPVFAREQRPDTFTIAEYFNKGVNQFLEKKYLSFPTYEQRLVMIDQNYDELSKLIIKSSTLTTERTLTGFNWGARGKKYRAPDNVLIPISLSCTLSRNEVYPMTSQNIFTKWVSRKQAERLISSSTDKVLHPQPVSFWEDPYYLYLIGDAYTTSITAGVLTFIRKPYKLNFDYAELTGVEDNDLNINVIQDGTYFLAKSYCTYVDGSGTPANYEPGSKVLKVAGHATVQSLNTETVNVGYPWGNTDTFDFPDYLHEQLVEIAVSLFLEAKLKLVQKAEN